VCQQQYDEVKEERKKREKRGKEGRKKEEGINMPQPSSLASSQTQIFPGF